MGENTPFPPFRWESAKIRFTNATEEGVRAVARVHNEGHSIGRSNIWLMTMTSVSELDRQFRLVRVHHKHRPELAGCVSLALAPTAWGSPGGSEKLCPA